MQHVSRKHHERFLASLPRASQRDYCEYKLYGEVLGLQFFVLLLITYVFCLYSARVVF